MKFSITLIGLSVAFGVAQNVTSTCREGFFPGRDEVIFTVPYTYAQVLSIIGSYGNLTWSGSPEGSVTLDGPDNTVGTTRTYDIVGAHVVEKIKTYSKPPNGPYFEDHSLALLTVPSANVSFYADYDATTVTPVCGGRASEFNFTAIYCGSDAEVAGQVLHTVHMQDAVTVGVFLGGMNFTSCASLGANGTATTTAPPIQVTANVATQGAGPGVVMVVVGCFVALLL